MVAELGRIQTDEPIYDLVDNRAMEYDDVSCDASNEYNAIVKPQIEHEKTRSKVVYDEYLGADIGSVDTEPLDDDSFPHSSDSSNETSSRRKRHGAKKSKPSIDRNRKQYEAVGDKLF